MKKISHSIPPNAKTKYFELIAKEENSSKSRSRIRKAKSKIPNRVFLYLITEQSDLYYYNTKFLHKTDLDRISSSINNMTNQVRLFIEILVSQKNFKLEQPFDQYKGAVILVLTKSNLHIYFNIKHIKDLNINKQFLYKKLKIEVIFRFSPPFRNTTFRRKT